MRLFLEAGLIYVWGPQIKVFIDRYFNQLALAFVGLVVLGMWGLTR